MHPLLNIHNIVEFIFKVRWKISENDCEKLFSLFPTLHSEPQAACRALQQLGAALQSNYWLSEKCRIFWSFEQFPDTGTTPGMQLGSHLPWAGIRKSILNYIGDFLIPKHLTESFLREQFSNERTMNLNSIFPWYLFDQAVLILTTCSNCSNVDPTTRGDGKTKTGSVEHTDKKDWLRWGRVAKFQSASFSEIVRACDCCQKYFTCSLHHDPSSLSPGHWGGQGWPQRPPLYLQQNDLVSWFDVGIKRRVHSALSISSTIANII